MGYLQTFLPAEYKVEAVKLYSNYLRNSFYQSHSNIILEKNSFVFAWIIWKMVRYKSQRNILYNDEPYRSRYHVRSKNINQDESQEINC